MSWVRAPRWEFFFVSLKSYEKTHDPDSTSVLLLPSNEDLTI